MSENPQDSPADVLDDEEVQLPTIASGDSPGEPSSAGQAPDRDPETLGQLADALAEMLEPRLRDSLRPDVERTVQSVKDSRLGKFDHIDPEDVKLVADALKRSGGDPEKAAQDLGIRALLEERRNQQSDQSAPASQAAQPSPTDSRVSEEEQKQQVKKILSDSGLTKEESQEVLTDWAGQSYRSFDDSLAGLTRMAIQKVRPPQPTSPGAVVPSGEVPLSGDAEARALSVASLYEELQGLFSNPTANAERITEVKSRLKELGEQDI